MLKLIVKDLYINRAQLLTPLAIVFAIYAAGLVFRDQVVAGYAMTFLGTYAVLVTPMFALASLQTEEKNRTLGFLCTMPISPGEIVASKFLATLVLAGVTATLFTALARLGPSLMPMEAVRETWGNPSCFLLIALTLPVAAAALIAFFKSGVSAARTVVMVGVAVFAFGSMMLSRQLGVHGNLIAGMFDPGPGPTAAVLVVALCLYTLGYLVAKKVFENRELS